ncbi:glycosyltransferase family 8 protein [Alcanivorax limicola]|uniref:glycosyltransferase family 8 protein n=1 Tax=Alcanivorax limicola TaxID=2874102 RepID=UPI001CC1BFFA|nr:glycosyltransferase family 8 protein [Alcanivorax limicola]
MIEKAAPGDGAIHVALCCDENYAAFSTVVMLSAIRSARRPGALFFHLVSSGVSAETRLLIEKEIHSHGAQIQIYEADKASLFDKLPAGRFGHAVYQRILLGECLPKSVSRAIYLDGDVLVKQDLEALWSTDLRGFLLAAVEDLSRSACKTLGIPRSEYFNSGVLLMDLGRWRSEGVHWQVAEYAAQNAHRLRYVDQCSLNAVLQGRWLRLHPKWNVQAGIYKTLRRYPEGSGYGTNELMAAAALPGIIHYTGKRKPWLQYCFHPEKLAFRDILDGLVWVDRHPSRRGLREKLIYFLAVRHHLKAFLYKRLTRKLRSDT